MNQSAFLKGLSHNETRLNLLHVAYCDKSHNETRCILLQSRNDTRFILLRVAYRYTLRLSSLKTTHKTPVRTDFGSSSNQNRWFELKPLEKFPFRLCFR